MGHKTRPGVTWPWQPASPHPQPGHMELAGSSRVSLPQSPNTLSHLPLPMVRPPLQGHPAPRPWSARQPASPPLGPPGPCSAAPPELPCLRILDRAVCLGGSGGPEDDHRAPRSCPPLPRGHSCTEGGGCSSSRTTWCPGRPGTQGFTEPCPPPPTLGRSTCSLAGTPCTHPALL